MRKTVIGKKRKNMFFCETDNEKAPFSIFDFTFLNHTSNTVLFKKVSLNIKELPSGILGRLNQV
jgi:hypothetical protein